MRELPTTRTSYVSRVGQISHQAARQLALPQEVEDIRGARLVLRDTQPSMSSEPFWSDYRVYPAFLRIPGRRTRLVPVEVELAPWSATRTEVGLRFNKSLHPGGRRHDFDAAAGAVEALVQALERQASRAPQRPVLGRVA